MHAVNINALPDTAVYPVIADYNDMFQRESAAERPVLLTDFDMTSAQDKERLTNVLLTRYDDDIQLDVIPSCDCGILQGQILIGLKCKTCHSKVDYITERDLKPSLWLEVPNGVKAFIHPHIYKMLHGIMGTGNSNVLEWLVNPYYRPATKTKEIQAVESLNIPRGLNYFHDHFGDIMYAVFSKRIIKQGAVKSAWEFLEKHRHLVFCRYLPVPSKLAFITEANGSAIYTDKTMKSILEGVHTINSVISEVIPLSEKQRESKVAIAIHNFAEYYHSFMGVPTTKKEGIIRQHIVGGRLHFTARAVVSSISAPHRHDEIVIPWGVAVSLFKLHLCNLLGKMGMTPNESLGFLNQYMNTYHPLLDQLFQILINEGDGMWATLARNPHLNRLSIQYFRIGGVRGMHNKPEDVRINTIGISVLVLVAPNCDFDSSLSLSLEIMIEKLF